MGRLLLLCRARPVRRDRLDQAVSPAMMMLRNTRKRSIPWQIMPGRIAFIAAGAEFVVHEDELDAVMRERVGGVRPARLRRDRGNRSAGCLALIHRNIAVYCGGLRSRGDVQFLDRRVGSACFAATSFVAVSVISRFVTTVAFRSVFSALQFFSATAIRFNVKTRLRGSRLR
jgi:hypothetical protein